VTDILRSFRSFRLEFHSKNAAPTNKSAGVSYKPFWANFVPPLTSKAPNSEIAMIDSIERRTIPIFRLIFAFKTKELDIIRWFTQRKSNKYLHKESVPEHQKQNSGYESFSCQEELEWSRSYGPIGALDQ